MQQDECQAAPLKVAIRRSAGGAEWDEEFEVPSRESQTVLDVVSWIQQYADPSLSYRYACRVGMCGSCAMTVNGTPRWTCRTHVRKVAGDGTLRIGPLRNFPVIKDLAVDMDPFFEKWIDAGGVHDPSRDREAGIAPIPPASRERECASAGIECINCGICHAGCDTVAGNPDYLGPAALQRVWTLYNDERHADRESLLALVSGRGGCHNCHAMATCSNLCPNGLDPAGAIAGLKRETARKFFGLGSRSRPPGPGQSADPSEVSAQ